MNNFLKQNNFIHLKTFTDPNTNRKGNEYVYFERLRGHSSCVNALCISSGSGRFMASGGDDKNVKIWDLSVNPGENNPILSYVGHISNIFALQFDSKNKHVWSCGNDQTIIRHPLEDQTANHDHKTVFEGHTGSVQQLSISPANDDVVLSASQDGTIKLWDTRLNSKSSQTKNNLVEAHTEFCSVKFNPVYPELYVITDYKGNAILKDLRTGCDRVWINKLKYHDYTSKNVVVKYITKLTKNRKYADPEVMSVDFDVFGKRMVSTVGHFYPTVYNVQNPTPIMYCSSSPTVINQTAHSYVNKCTQKNASFGGPESKYILCGSDDFGVYMWKLPSEKEFEGERVYHHVNSKYCSEEDITYSAFGEPLKIRKVEDPEVLLGHKSIVNTSIWHPSMPFVYTCGVERDIGVFGTTSFNTKTQLKKEDYIHRRRSNGLPMRQSMRLHRYSSFISYQTESFSPEINEMRTISLFDTLLEDSSYEQLLFEDIENLSISSEED